MSATSLDGQLSLMEQQLDEAFRALVAAEVNSLRETSRRMQDIAVGLAPLLGISLAGRLTAVQTQRIKNVATRLPMLRENLARCASMVDRAVAIVVPTERQSTYAVKGAYGSAMRQTGTVKGLLA
jgi:hypothetical protein